VHTHTGEPFGRVTEALLDEEGRLFLASARGLGLVRSVDMAAAADAVEQGRWPLEDVPFELLPARFGYRLSPAVDLAQRP
jgi:hypothetical protein